MVPMRNAALVEQVLALDPEERREVVAIAANSLAPVSEETLDLVEAEVNRWQTDPSYGTPWEEVWAEMRARRP